MSRGWRTATRVGPVAVSLIAVSLIAVSLIAVSLVAVSLVAVVSLPGGAGAAVGESVSSSPPAAIRTQLPTTLTITGQGLARSDRYDVTFDNRSIATIGAVVFGGSDHANWRLPRGTACGDHLIAISNQGPPSGPGSVAAADASVTFHVYCPRIALNPTGVPAGQLPVTIDVLPNGDFDYAGDDQYKLLFLDGAPLGRFGYKKPISFPADPSCGAHTVRLVQPSQVGLLDAAARFTVICPGVTVQPGAISRDSQPRPVTVTATGFEPDEGVSISVDGVLVASSVLAGNGGLSTGVTVKGLRCGTRTVTVTETSSALAPPPTASAPLVVRCPRAAVALDPVVISAGMTTHVTGTGFVPGHAVTLSWRLGDGTAEAVDGSPVVADAGGRIDVFCLLMQHDALGGRVLIAKDASVTATAGAVVAGGSMQPSGHGGQIVFRR